MLAAVHDMTEVRGGFSEEVSIEVRGVALQGELVIPPGAVGIVVFAHGSGSSRSSPRNRYVAGRLNRARFGTLLFDLLTSQEELAEMRGALRRFDIETLSDRMMGATEWLSHHREARGLDLAFFGASTGAAAALVAAARRPANVRAVVSRGGRPDLAGEWLKHVLCPTLLIVGENDGQVIELNRWAQSLLPRCELRIVPRAGHLFEEPGTLELVAEHALQWFKTHLARPESVEQAHV